MNTNDIEQQLTEINDKLQMLSEKQNSQFTEIMMELKKLAIQITNTQEDIDVDDDDLYEDAKEAVIKAGKASTSLLQRKLRIGYGRACRLIDMLEEHGVVGPADGAKGREVLITG
jgi:S-DNA-T family DNA segregation ATPase FtsK/SpoIIIE